MSVRVIGTGAPYKKTFLQTFKEQLRGSDHVIIVPGFFKKSGFDKVKDDVLNFVRKKGQLEIYADKNPYWSALDTLYELQKKSSKKKGVAVRVFDDDEVEHLHSKVALFYKSDGTKCAIVGSVNISSDALMFNVETAALFPVEDSSLETVIKWIRNRSRKIKKAEYEDYLKNSDKYEKRFRRLFKQKSTLARGTTPSRVQREAPSEQGEKRFWKVASGDPTWGKKNSRWGWDEFYKRRVIANGKTRGRAVDVFKTGMNIGDIVVCTLRRYPETKPGSVLGIGWIRGEYRESSNDDPRTKEFWEEGWSHIRDVEWKKDFEQKVLDDRYPKKIRDVLLRRGTAYQIRNEDTRNQILSWLRESKSLKTRGGRGGHGE